jgi:predicted DNA-binding ribbon-helix-helix protein
MDSLIPRLAVARKDRRIPDARVIKRSLVIAGHRTSVSLEDAFWRRLGTIAAERGLSLNSLAAMIDASRDGANLSSAIRVFVLEAESAAPSRPAGDGSVRVDQ